MPCSPGGWAHTLLAPAAALTVLTALSVGAARADPAADPLARELVTVRAVCAKCHNLQIVMDTPMSYEGWHDTVQKMIDRGADATDEQLADIMDYLHHTMTTLDVNSADPDELAIVLGAPDPVVRAIVSRRAAKKFKNIDDLKTVPGIDAAAVDAKSRFLFFQ